MKATGKNTKHFFKIMDAQAKCLALLENMSVVVLKGAASAMYYPQP